MYSINTNSNTPPTSTICLNNNIFFGTIYVKVNKSAWEDGSGSMQSCDSHVITVAGVRPVQALEQEYQDLHHCICSQPKRGEREGEKKKQISIEDEKPHPPYHTHSIRIL